jgi:hypothetical protein
MTAILDGSKDGSPARFEAIGAFARGTPAAVIRKQLFDAWMAGRKSGRPAVA